MVENLLIFGVGDKDTNILCSLICERGDIGSFTCSVGSMDVGKGEYFQEYYSEITESTCSMSDASDNVIDPGENWLVAMEVPHHCEIDLYKIMSSASHSSTRRNISAEHLSKVWQIYLYAAGRIIDITYQNCGRVDDQKFSRNYGENDTIF